jgi:hypothetical protein
MQSPANDDEIYRLESISSFFSVSVRACLGFDMEKLISSIEIGNKNRNKKPKQIAIR